MKNEINEAAAQAYNPPGYIDHLGLKHEWRLHEGWVKHYIDGRFFSMQLLEGFLEYGIASLLMRTRTPPASGELDQAYETAIKLAKKNGASKVSVEYNGITYTVVPHRLGRKIYELEQRLAALTNVQPVNTDKTCVQNTHKNAQSLVKRIEDIQAIFEYGISDFETEDRQYVNDVFDEVTKVLTAIPAAGDGWIDISKLKPKEGRVRLLCNGVEYEGWFEDNFDSWLSMDCDWNLIKIIPTHWRCLPAPPLTTKMAGEDVV